MRAGTTVVVSESDRSHWARRQGRLDFGPNVYFCTPLGSMPTMRRWRRFINHLLDLADDRPFDLLVIDPLASFLPAAENHARALLKALDELRLITHQFAGVLLLHHPRRAGGAVGQMARGSGALPAFADILLEMSVAPGGVGTRRRRLHGVGRYPETPQQLLFEMNAEATDYALLDEADEQEHRFACALDALRELLSAAPSPLTRHEIRELWPDAATRPTANTLWRWLTRARAAGVLRRHGEGSKADAFRYDLAPPGPDDARGEGSQR